MYPRFFDRLDLTDPSIEIARKKSNHLPHWTMAGGTYAITFRLVDSLPASVIRALQQERDELITKAAPEETPLSLEEKQRLDRLLSDKIEAYLDAGAGECWLRQPEIARIVADALRHFDGERYDLDAWCVMPNHIHVVMRPRRGFDVPDILHSWKSFTSTAANKVLGRAGKFWQKEYYDRLIRDAG